MEQLTIVDVLKLKCRDKEINLTEHAAGHFVIYGEVNTVHYWPTSKNRTCWIEGSKRRGITGCNVTTAVNLATKG